MKEINRKHNLDISENKILKTHKSNFQKIQLHSQNQ